MTADLQADRPLLLGGRPVDAALVCADGVITYGDLADRVGRARSVLGDEPRLLLLEAANDVSSVVTYLAALAGRHPVILAAPGDADRHRELGDRYDPDVVQRAGHDLPEPARDRTRHDLHPDLAVLLSTSGSTGSPKLVRLSRANLLANAESIGQYLHLRPTDRGITTLPLHYSYGLSILNSHLAAGAAVVLTDLSVADECFWDLAARAGATNLAGVPYTFDLLDASGFERRDLPSLRFVTQAGGRLAPDRVASYAALGRRSGWDFFVMYGQTEATARIAYLPPDRAASRPESIGIPVPGGHLHLEPVPGIDEPGVGELVYTGPNVMMGYAESAADLAAGAELDRLRTGDLARRADDGLWEITGRLNRYAKVFGLRLDLDRIENHLADAGIRARVVATDQHVHVFVDRPRTVARATAAVGRLVSLPPTALTVSRVDTFPRTPSGKTDYATLAQQATLAGRRTCADGPVSPDSVRDLYAELLGRPDATTADSFIDLRGDSLSYVEVSVRLGAHLGTLPADWPRRSPRQLASGAVHRRRFVAPIDASIVLRALAVVAIVASHADVVQLQGGAHVLLAVVGFNLARFQLTVPGRRARVRALLRTAASIAVPTFLWISAVEIIELRRIPVSAVFMNGLLGSNSWSEDWEYWFLEAIFWSFLGLAALLAVPALDRWQRRRPFGAAMLVLAAALALRYAWVGIEAGATERYTLGPVLWCLALGCAAALARSTPQRLLVGLIAPVVTVGFFGDLQRELIVTTGILVLLLVPTVPVPRAVAAALRVIAAASLWIYLTQWEVYPELEAAGHPYVAIVAALVVGVVCCALYGLARRRVADRIGARGTALPGLARR